MSEQLSSPQTELWTQQASNARNPRGPWAPRKSEPHRSSLQSMSIMESLGIISIFQNHEEIQSEPRCDNKHLLHKPDYNFTYCPSFADSDSSKTKNGHLKYWMLETLKDLKLPGSQNQAGAAHIRSIRTNSNVNHGKPGLYQQLSEPWRRIVIWATMW